MDDLSHVDDKGRARMVDVGGKSVQHRVAVAEGMIELGPVAIDRIRENAVSKGDVLRIAELAGVQAAKKTPELIPLCHPLGITKADVTASIEGRGVRVTALVSSVGRTGVEMEALTAVSVALLTVYDMIKAVDKNMIISGIRLVEKTKSDLKTK